MISVLVLGFDRAERQAATAADAVRTLAALVPAIVEGIVRDVCLAGPAEGTGLANVADHAGCTFAAAPDLAQALASGGAHLRCPQVLVARAGMVIDRGVIEELSNLLPTLGADNGASYLLRAERPDFLGRLFPSLSPIAGLLCARTALLEPSLDSLKDLVQRTKARRALKATAWMAG